MVRNGDLEVAIVSNATGAVVQKSKVVTTPGIDVKVEWSHGDMSLHVSTIIQLEFKMRLAHLFAFQVQP